MRHCTDEMMNNPAVTKATPKRLRDTFEVQDTPGKRFKKNPVVRSFFDYNKSNSRKFK